MDYISINYEPWKIVKLLGKGSFGSVFEIERQEFGETYKAALKVISIPQSDSEIAANRADGMDNQSMTVYYDSVVKELTHEFALLSKLKGHTNVVSYEDHKVVPHKDGIGWDIYIRMELLTPLTEISSIYEFSEAQAIKLGIDICHALTLCNYNSIIHRDIKPDNIFASETGDFELGDFGIARTASKTISNMSRKGTPNYMAPEVYLNQIYNGNVDIYSLGIVLYQLMNARRLPFIPEKVTITAREASLGRRMSGEPLPPPQNASKQFSDIILKACAFDPKNRYEDAASMQKDLQSLLGDKDGIIDMIRIKKEIANMKNNINDGQFHNNRHEYGEGFYNQNFPNNSMNDEQNQYCSNSTVGYGNKNQIGNCNGQGISSNMGDYCQNQINNTGNYSGFYGYNNQSNIYGNPNLNGTFQGTGYALNNDMNNENSSNFNSQINGGNSQGYNGLNNSQTMGETMVFQQPLNNAGNSDKKNEAPKLKRNNTIMIIAGGVALLILILIAVVLKPGKKNNNEDDVAIVNKQESVEEEIRKEVVAEETVVGAESEEPVTDETVNAVAMSDNWEDFTIEFMGEIIALPAKYSDFSYLGWTVYSYGGDISETDNLSAGESVSTYLSNGAGKISVNIFNPTGNLLEISECKVYGLNIYARDNIDIKLAKNISIMSSVDDITSAYGMPSTQSSGDGYVTLKYEDTSYTSRLSFMVYDDTTYNSIDISNKVATEEDVTTVSEDRPAYLSTYNSPTDIGSDPTKPLFRIAGANYQLPCPLSAFTDQGWNVVNVYSQYLGAMNKESNAITIEKDSIKLTLEMANPDNVMHYIDDCMVSEVQFNEYTMKNASSGDYLQLPSGLTNKDLAERSWIANNYSLDKKYLNGLTKDNSENYDNYEFYYGDYYYDSSLYIKYSFSKKDANSYTVVIKCYDWNY